MKPVIYTKRRKAFINEMMKLKDSRAKVNKQIRSLQREMHSWDMALVNE